MTAAQAARVRMALADAGRARRFPAGLGGEPAEADLATARRMTYRLQAKGPCAGALTSALAGHELALLGIPAAVAA